MSVDSNHPIRQIFLHVTKACNLKCDYCYYSARRAARDELTDAELSTLWPQMVQLAPRKLVFTGGEPLLRLGLIELIEELAQQDTQHRILRCLNTNGLRVHRSVARALVGVVDEVRVSIDALRERNDRLRGPGSFDAAIRAIDNFYAVGFEPKALVTLTSESLPDLERLIDLLRAHGVRRINVNGLQTIGRGAAHPDWVVESHEVRTRVARLLERRGETTPSRPATVQPNCGVGRYLNITARGDVFPCHVLAHSAFACGNVRDTSLIEICRDSGLLGQLRRLDFGMLVRSDSGFRLVGPDACLGAEYTASRRDKRWSRLLADMAESPDHIAGRVSDGP